MPPLRNAARILDQRRLSRLSRTGPLSAPTARMVPPGGSWGSRNADEQAPLRPADARSGAARQEEEPAFTPGLRTSQVLVAALNRILRDECNGSAHRVRTEKGLEIEIQEDRLRRSWIRIWKDSMSDIVSRPNQNQRNESAVIIVRQCAVASSARFGGAVILQPLRSRFHRSSPRPQWIVLSQ